MELELTRTHLACYDTILDTTLLHEETMEMIVPDACPDILRIADTVGTVCLKHKETADGRAELSGTARCAVLYLPDGELGMRRLEVNIPFTCTAEVAGAHAACTLIAVPRILTADTRAINPRKILVRVNLAISVQVMAPATLALCTGTETESEVCVEQLKESHNAYMATCVQEKPFTFSDDLTVSGSRPEIAELLKHKVMLNCTESKIIGNKLIFKGDAALRICYRGVDGSVTSIDFELPFSQIMEVTGVGEEADCTMEVVLTDLSCGLEAGDGRTVSVSMGLLAQAVIREERSIELLTDIYSTACDLSVETQLHTMNDLLEHNTRRQTIRELVEPGIPARSVIDAGVSIGTISQSREGGRLLFSAEAILTVLYVTEESELYAVSRQINVPCQVEVPEGCHCTCSCKCPGEVFATPTTSGIEVRFDLDFHALALAPRRVAGVCGLQVGEGTRSESGTEPSMVLRVVGQERLWDIAKAYRTTMADIMQANELEDENALSGRLLLIPKKR